MSSAVGSFLLTYSTAIDASLANAIGPMQAWVFPALCAAVPLYYGVKGIQAVNGDTSAFDNFVPQLIRIGLCLWLCGDVDAFNNYVVAMLYNGLPNALNNAAAAAGGSVPGVAVSIGNPQPTAAVFDLIEDQIGQTIALCWQHAGLTDWRLWIAGCIGDIGTSLSLYAAALVILLGKFLLAIVTIFLVPIIACAAFPVTTPFFERTIGKLVSLVLLQAGAIIVTEIFLSVDKTYVAGLLNSMQANAAAAPAPGVGGWFQNFMSVAPRPPIDTANETRGLLAMTATFIAGAFATMSLTTIAYSIGGGIAVSGTSTMLGLMAAWRGARSVAGAVASRMPSLPAPMPQLPPLSAPQRALPAPPSVPFPPLSLR